MFKQYALWYAKGEYKITEATESNGKILSRCYDIIAMTVDIGFLTHLKTHLEKSKLDPYHVMKHFKAVMAVVNFLENVGYILQLNDSWYCDIHQLGLEDE